MKILSIIPARGDSKGIPMKNLVLVNKIPLLQYSINASLKSQFINKTVISTDDIKIERVAKKLGAIVIKRPKKIAGDKSPIEETINHTLNYLEKNEKYVPDIIILLQNTSPLRTSKHIEEAIRFFQKNNYDSVLSGFSSHYFLWKKKGKFSVPQNYNPLKRPNRQDMKDEFIENGAIYITKYKSFKKTNCRISGKIGLFVMQQELSYEMDNENDLFITEQILKTNRID